MAVANPYESPNSDEEDTNRGETPCPAWFDMIMSATAVLATFGSIAVFAWCGEQEPFYGPFDLTDALVMLVGGGIGLVVWSIWSLVALLAVRWRWWKPSMLLLLLFGILFGYLNYSSFAEYVADRAAWAEMQREG